MVHKSYFNKLVLGVETLEVSFPESVSTDEICKFNELVTEGKEIQKYPKGTSRAVIFSYIIDSKRFTEWDDVKELNRIGDAAVESITKMGFTYDQYMWYVDNLNPEDMAKFIYYLGVNKYEGETADELIDNFYNMHAIYVNQHD